jgi:hypothetical protein
VVASESAADARAVQVRVRDVAILASGSTWSYKWDWSVRPTNRVAIASRIGRRIAVAVAAAYAGACAADDIGTASLDKAAVLSMRFDGSQQIDRQKSSDCAVQAGSCSTVRKQWSKETTRIRICVVRCHRRSPAGRCGQSNPISRDVM